MSAVTSTNALPGSKQEIPIKEETMLNLKDNLGQLNE